MAPVVSFMLQAKFKHYVDTGQCWTTITPTRTALKSRLVIAKELGASRDQIRDWEMKLFPELAELRITKAPQSEPKGVLSNVIEEMCRRRAGKEG